jgi:hypothetical protein
MMSHQLGEAWNDFSVDLPIWKWSVAHESFDLEG